MDINFQVINSNSSPNEGFSEYSSSVAALTTLASISLIALMCFCRKNVNSEKTRSIPTSPKPFAAISTEILSAKDSQEVASTGTSVTKNDLSIKEIKETIEKLEKIALQQLPIYELTQGCVRRSKNLMDELNQNRINIPFSYLVIRRNPDSFSMLSYEQLPDIQWNYHVVLTFKLSNQNYIIDPLHFNEPVTKFDHWLSEITNNQPQLFSAAITNSLKGPAYHCDDTKKINPICVLDNSDEMVNFSDINSLGLL